MGEVSEYTVKQADELVRRAIQRSQQRHELWRRLENLFRSGTTDGVEAEAVVEKVPDLTLDRINYTLPHAQMVLATMVGEDPELTVEPWESGGDPDQAEAGAKKAEGIVRYFWKRANGLERLADAAQDAVVLGNGFLKVGWAHDEREVERDPVEVEEELADLLEHDRLQADLEQRDPTDPDELADLVDTHTTVVDADEPWIEYVSPYDIFVPHDARRLDESRWIAQRVRLPLDEIKANEAFDDEAKDELSQSVPGYGVGAVDDVKHRDERGEGPRPSGGVTTDGEEDALAEATLIEFYDMRSRRLLVFQQGASKALYDDALPYSHRYPPFVHMRLFNDGGSRFWAFGALENIAPIQTQLNDVIADWIDNLKRQGNKYAVDKEALTTEARSALESNEPEQIVPLELSSMPARDVIEAMPRQGVPQDIYAGREDLQNAIIEQLGLNDFQTGGTGADRMSGTAAAVVDGTASLRASGPRKQVERAAARIGTLIALLSQEFLEPERAVRIVGPEGAQWINVHRSELLGEYHINVNAGSTESINPSAREQQAVEQLQSVVPQLVELGYDPEPVLRELVRDLGYDPDITLRRVQAEQPAEGGEPPPAGAPGVGGAGGEPTQSDLMEQMGGPPMPQQERGAPAL